ncbi:MAG: DUF4336 domain-containing protein [Hyphomicrobiaceae bacterium]|nr:DUF4336 domain-containing protein [Hyphomicrobiaceae bacterium]
MLEAVDKGIWIAEGECVNFHGFPYPTRCVVVRLNDGPLWVWSPIRLTESLKGEIDRIGKPEYLVSPNKIHHLFLQEWASAYPGATMWGPRSTIAKRKDLSFQAPLTDDPPDAWRSEIDQVWFNGSVAMDEIVFFHRASRTVIMADLSENFSEAFLKAHWKPWQRAIARIWRIVEGYGYAPLEWRLSFLNRKATRRTRDAVLGWNPERVIMAHGEWQRSNARAYLERAFAWM